MRRVQLAIVVFAAACSSAGSAPPTGGIQEQSVTIAGASSGTSALRLTHESSTNMHELDAPADRVWRVLRAAFDSVGIPPETIDPATRTMGNVSFKAHGRLKGTPLSRFIDCGESTQIGSNADNYDIVMTFAAQVQAAEPGHAWLAVSLEAVGRPATFAQDYSRCSSKGELENRFTAIIERALDR